jgi:hypothetical protein
LRESGYLTSLSPDMFTLSAKLTCDCPGCANFLRSGECESEARAKMKVRLEVVESGWRFIPSGPENRSLRALCPGCATPSHYPVTYNHI